MITLSNVTKRYGAVAAVDELSFHVDEGEIFGLIGTSGCGKTTTLRMINRLEEPNSGSIAIGGTPVLDRLPEQLRRHIGYVIQDVGLFPHYSVRENVAVAPRLLQWDPARIQSRTDELLELTGLPPGTYADRMPAALSGGQQQRVGLARALAADPPVILMDEPFGALDPITKERVRGEFKGLLQAIKKTIVLVTHDVFEAFELCDRLCLMDQGRARQIGPPRELLFRPNNDFVRSFFDTHRFQLQMMSITIEDILHATGHRLNSQERPAPKGAPGDGATIKTADSFFSVFESSEAGQRFTVLNQDEKVTARITTDQLLKGFQQVRRKLREGDDD